MENSARDLKDDTANIGWYVSDTHCVRAIGYLSAKLVREGHLQPEFRSTLLLDLWGEALSETMNVDEPSPIGPDSELASHKLRRESEAKS